MIKTSEYRGLAAKFRREADEAVLPHWREMNLRAAEKWEALADEAEVTAGLDATQADSATAMHNW